jgi:hypothetical protein
MPTIGQLPSTSSVSDIDEIPVFQNGQTVSATRAQILAGYQPAIALPQGVLLGGIGPGTTGPAPVTIGSNLALTGSILSATAAPFIIEQLAAGAIVNSTDLIPVGQDGNNVSVSYESFMQALGSVAGVQGGNLNATASGATTSRILSKIAANFVSIEDFGAVGDGVTDDGPALLAALSSGNPVRFGPKTYVIDGECDISGTNATLIGCAGLTILTRSGQTHVGSSGTPAWLSINATNFCAEGIIFDANRSIVEDTWAVVVQKSCVSALVTRCLFRNAMGLIYGWGLAVAPSDPLPISHHIYDCEFCNNAVDGVWIAATDGVSITECRSHDNGRNGIYVDSQDPSFVLKIRNIHVIANTCWNNQAGIVVGNFNATNTVPGIYGNSNPDVLGALVSGNNLYNNVNYGISISGKNINVTSNLLVNNSTGGNGGGGILANTGYCRIADNMIAGAGDYGVDAGGAIFSEVSNNYVNGALIGLNVGGSQNCSVQGNFIQNCTGTAIMAVNVESDGRGNNFGIPCNNLVIRGNWISYSSGAQGIVLRDAPQVVLIADNVITANAGADPLVSLIPYTDSLTLKNNILNFASSWLVNPGGQAGTSTLIFPDLVDSVTINQAPSLVASIISATTSRTIGQVTFAKVVSPGANYSQASISFAGTGAGATGGVFISNGEIIGIYISNGGTGYGPGTTATITGDGSGATASIQVSLPVIQNRHLVFNCQTSVQFGAEGSMPAQVNWTGAQITVPAGSSIDWIGNNNGWQATRFTQSDYLSPNGDGSVTFHSQSGDISLCPASNGAVRLVSDSEPTGCISLIGRGSPISLISAPPGSTFRNLNGGIGTTFWVKQVGISSEGWSAIA